MSKFYKHIGTKPGLGTELTSVGAQQGTELNMEHQNEIIMGVATPWF